ncbi:MAG: hypothetical protein PHU73_04270 [Patescibacteria group bacterium]|nr:hypothetical protein [Patescibacteria group bacterium]
MSAKIAKIADHKKLGFYRFPVYFPFFAHAPTGGAYFAKAFGTNVICQFAPPFGD